MGGRRAGDVKAITMSVVVSFPAANLLSSKTRRSRRLTRHVKAGPAEIKSFCVIPYGKWVCLATFLVVALNRLAHFIDCKVEKGGIRNATSFIAVFFHRYIF